MQYGICLLSVIPGRKEATNTSEMVTQLLFGEHYTVTDTTEGWLKIMVAYDNYECWINIKQHTKISESTFNQIQKQDPIYSNELIQVISNKNSNTNFPLSLGASLPFLKDKTLNFEAFNFSFEGQVTQDSQKKTAKDIISTAYLLINAPYLWGGKSPFGIDCSGFTQIVYKLNGYKLPRDASQQVELGTPLSFVEEAEAGDLAFFDNEEGNIVHVGILLDNQQIIHASGSVRIDKFDHYGIFSSDTKKYSHTLRVIKKIL
ncbi:MAG: C40 family peptidase [Bacteroidota bacterium]|nr:C40 family peptidase [Bacteroidota bacterium]MDP3143903.1 C40 family peptidase [Bacteroidota bacterium]MDP3558051.1 C40 family peptidase [Bacteroidota bacterium]